MYSEPFWAAYYRRSDAKPVENGLKSEVSGSISVLIAQYYTSSSFTDLAAATKNVYRRQFEPGKSDEADQNPSALIALLMRLLLCVESKTIIRKAHASDACFALLDKRRHVNSNIDRTAAYHSKMH